MSTAKKKYKQSFRDSYLTEFPCIKKSHLEYSAFCTICLSDFKVCWGGRTAIQDHLKSSRHLTNVEAAEKLRKTNKINSYFSSSASNSDLSVINAECLFTQFLVEHNLPISAADHAGPLFRKMFPDSAIAEKYRCARTKSAAIINAMAADKKNDLFVKLQNMPFSVAVDGSNDNDSKIHPVVVTFYDEKIGKIESCVLALNPLQERATGKNIAFSILSLFEKHNISLKNCISFASDNAPVMVGDKGGVIHFLREQNPDIISMGCNCHLINLAAQKAAAAIPSDIEQTIIDIFYFLQRSSNRKEKFKKLQILHDTETRKILKHVPTRWLSLNKCLNRLVEQWKPLLSYFLQEVRKEPLEVSKVTMNRTKTAESDCMLQKRKATVTDEITKAKKLKTNEINKSIPKRDIKQEKPKKSQTMNMTREDKIFYFLSSEMNRAYCNFLLHVIPDFENKNLLLQSATPQIHKVKEILHDMLKNLFVKFLKPSVIKNNNLLEINFKNLANQKEDADLSVGNSAYEIVQNLKSEERAEFYQRVRKYFIEGCSYVRRKFPLNNDILENAVVCNLEKIESQSFDKVRFFVKKFPCILPIQENETETVAMDKLQEQFNSLQVEDISEIIKNERVDSQLHIIGRMKNVESIKKFDRIAHVLLSILTIPHSNAECERLFSLVKKNRTTFRSSLSDSSLENLLIIKCKEHTECYKIEFSKDVLQKAKKATTASLSKTDSLNEDSSF